ncbi:MAG TPA: gliding motility-associated protein GldE [Panacibacter sp.]|nr:gliding motility-associated protein GldE [Panacibacter sp.]HNP43250.1 gliding motility-associated protein GldE [Panacibacter sp.]
METVAATPTSGFKLAYLAVIDPQGTTVLFILLFVLMFFSFIVSGAEVAYFSLTHKEINLLKTKQQPAYKRVLDLLEHPKLLLASLLMANTFTNISIIIISNILLDGFFDAGSFIAFLAKFVFITILLVLFCEVMPKILARHNNIRYAKDVLVASVVEAMFYLFKRPAGWLVAYTDRLEKRLSGKSGSSYRIDEIYDAIDITTPGTDENSNKEKDILKGIAKFSNITVKQVMKTRLDVSGIDHKTIFKDLVRKIEELHYSRLPVYKDDLDEVLGIIHTKDVLPYIDSPDDFDWHKLMRQPFFVHEYKLIEDLLKEFQAKRIHFAIVVDEFGGTSGIVTMEDIIEEVIGEIKDEFDEEESGFKKLDEFNYIFDGHTGITDVCKMMELPLDTFNSVKGESDSLAGLVLEIAGEIPKVNQVASAGDFDFTVLETEKNRLKKIKISIRPQEEASKK